MTLMTIPPIFLVIIYAKYYEVTIDVNCTCKMKIIWLIYSDMNKTYDDMCLMGQLS